MRPKTDPRHGNRVAAVLMLFAASMGSVAATGTLPILFIALAMTFTLSAFVFAARGQSAGPRRAARPRDRPA